MDLNKVETLGDLIVKIYKYKFLPIFLMIITSICVFIWESNKKIIENYTIKIFPLPLIKFEKNFSIFSFNYPEKSNQIKKQNMDSLYSLNFSPLSFLFSFNDEIKNTISKNNNQLSNFYDLKKNTFLILENNKEQYSLQIHVRNLEESKKVNIFIEDLINMTNNKLKEDFKKIIEKKLKQISKEINFISLKTPNNIEQLFNLRLQLLEYEELLDKSNNLEFVSINMSNILVTNNKINKSKLITLSVFISLVISIGIILFIPNKN